MKLILHSYRRCPFCIRTRILLYLKGLEYEVVEEPLREWTPWMKDWTFATGERARVPVLRYVLDEGVEKIIPESNEINLFIDTVDGNPEYTPHVDSKEYEEMLEWFNWCKDELKPMIDLYKYGKDLQFDKEAHKLHDIELKKLIQVLENALLSTERLSNLDTVQGASEACDQAIVKSIVRGTNERSNDEMCQRGKSYLIKDRLTLADIAIIPFIRQIMRTREGEFDMSVYPNVLQWTNGIIEADWFRNAVMQQYS